MTVAGENLSDFCAASWSAYTSLLGAWTKAATDIYAVVAEWAVQEKEFLGVGEGLAYIHPARDMTLRANLVSVTDATAVPAGAITITPATISADPSATRPIRVVVKVDLGDGSAPAYKGEVVDENGAVVDDTVYVPMMSG